MTTEYIDFGRVVDRYDWDEDLDGPYPYTPEQVEAAEFFGKMDWEGGLDGLYQYGGSAYFPVELRELADEYGAAYEKLHEAVTSWGKSRGVVY